MLSRTSINAPENLSPEGQRIVAALVAHLEALNKTGSLQIEGALLDNTPIGLTTPASGAFTTLSAATSSVFPTTSATPVPTAASGSFTTVSSVLKKIAIGDRRFFHCTVTITTNNTAAGHVKVALGDTPLEFVGCGGISTLGLACLVHTSGELRIFKYDGSYPGADGVTLVVSGFYRV